MVIVFFFKQKTAYEIYQCDWSSDVCSSDLSQCEGGFDPGIDIAPAILGGGEAVDLASGIDGLGGAISRVAPFVGTTDAGALLQRAGFALPVADIEFHTIRYASPLALMEEIKSFCAANPLRERGRHLITPAHLASAIKAYQNIAGDKDGRVSASLEIIWMSGWSPHESQQKPLAPGSAQISLADVLGKKKR